MPVNGRLELKDENGSLKNSKMENKKYPGTINIPNKTVGDNNSKHRAKQQKSSFMFPFSVSASDNNIAIGSDSQEMLDRGVSYFMNPSGVFKSPYIPTTPDTAKDLTSNGRWVKSRSVAHHRKRTYVKKNKNKVVENSMDSLSSDNTILPICSLNPKSNHDINFNRHIEVNKPPLFRNVTIESNYHSKKVEMVKPNVSNRDSKNDISLLQNDNQSLLKRGETDIVSEKKDWRGFNRQKKERKYYKWLKIKKLSPGRKKNHYGGHVDDERKDGVNREIISSSIADKFIHAYERGIEEGEAFVSVLDSDDTRDKFNVPDTNNEKMDEEFKSLSPEDSDDHKDRGGNNSKHYMNDNNDSDLYHTIRSDDESSTSCSSLKSLMNTETDKTQSFNSRLDFEYKSLNDEVGNWGIHENRSEAKFHSIINHDNRGKDMGNSNIDDESKEITDRASSFHGLGMETKDSQNRSKEMFKIESDSNRVNTSFQSIDGQKSKLSYKSINSHNNKSNKDNGAQSQQLPSRDDSFQSLRSSHFNEKDLQTRTMSKKEVDTKRQSVSFYSVSNSQSLKTVNIKNGSQSHKTSRLLSKDIANRESVSLRPNTLYRKANSQGHYEPYKEKDSQTRASSHRKSTKILHETNDSSRHSISHKGSDLQTPKMSSIGSAPQSQTILPINSVSSYQNLSYRDPRGQNTSNIETSVQSQRESYSKTDPQTEQFSYRTSHSQNLKMLDKNSGSDPQTPKLLYEVSTFQSQNTLDGANAPIRISYNDPQNLDIFGRDSTSQRPNMHNEDETQRLRMSYRESGPQSGHQLQRDEGFQNERITDGDSGSQHPNLWIRDSFIRMPQISHMESALEIQEMSNKGRESSYPSLKMYGESDPRSQEMLNIDRNSSSQTVKKYGESDPQSRNSSSQSVLLHRESGPQSQEMLNIGRNSSSQIVILHEESGPQSQEIMNTDRDNRSESPKIYLERDTLKLKTSFSGSSFQSRKLSNIYNGPESQTLLHTGGTPQSQSSENFHNYGDSHNQDMPYREKNKEMLNRDRDNEPQSPKMFRENDTLKLTKSFSGSGSQSKTISFIDNDPGSQIVPYRDDSTSQSSDSLHSSDDSQNQEMQYIESAHQNQEMNEEMNEENGDHGRKKSHKGIDKRKSTEDTKIKHGGNELSLEKIEPVNTTSVVINGHDVEVELGKNLSFNKFVALFVTCSDHELQKFQNKSYNILFDRKFRTTEIIRAQKDVVITKKKEKAGTYNFEIDSYSCPNLANKWRN